MTFAPKEIILGASVPLENGGSVTISVAGHIEAERAEARLEEMRGRSQ